jgi:FkbM family methyltransferase
MDERLDKIAQHQQEMIALVNELEPILNSLVMNDTAIIEALAHLLTNLQQMQTRSEQNQTRMAEELEAVARQLLALNEAASSSKEPIVIGADQFALENPEIGLLEYLGSFLSDRTALDVGAHIGRVSERLLKAGCEVYAFEPHLPTFEKLRHNLDGGPKFHAFSIALGSHDATMNLHLASKPPGSKSDPTLYSSLGEHPMDDLRFTETVPVQVRSLASLRESGEIPNKAGLLKIDAEGFDIEVIRGMGEPNYAVVMTEFWDPAHRFGQSGKGRLEDLVAEMRRRGYPWHIVIYHLDEDATISYYCNRTDTVSGSWGNIVFCREHAIFSKAARWCEQVLAPTLHR